MKGTFSTNYFHFSDAVVRVAATPRCGSTSDVLHSPDSERRDTCELSPPVVVTAALNHKTPFCLWVLYLTTSRGNASLAEDAFVSDYNHDL